MANYREQYERWRKEIIHSICKSASSMPKIPIMFAELSSPEDFGGMWCDQSTVCIVEIFPNNECSGYFATDKSETLEPFGLCEFNSESLIGIYEHLKRVRNES